MRGLASGGAGVMRIAGRQGSGGEARKQVLRRLSGPRRIDGSCQLYAQATLPSPRAFDCIRPGGAEEAALHLGRPLGAQVQARQEAPSDWKSKAAVSEFQRWHREDFPVYFLRLP